METGMEVGGGSSRVRRHWTVNEKRRIVEESLSSTRSMASLAREHDLNANQLFYWRKLYHAGQLAAESSVDGSSLRLLPVLVRDEEPAEAKVSDTERDARESTKLGLTLNIEIPGRALVSLAGAVDVEMVRAVLESLRG